MNLKQRTVPKATVPPKAPAPSAASSRATSPAGSASSEAGAKKMSAAALADLFKASADRHGLNLGEVYNYMGLSPDASTTATPPPKRPRASPAGFHTYKK